MIAKPDRRHWVYYYARGTSYERLKNWPPAEADLKKALELYPDQPLVLNYLGYSWIDQGIQLDEGMRLIERAVAVKPDDGYIVDSLGWAHYKRGNYAEAVRYLERAVELRPDDPVLNDHLGDALWKVGREREAKFQWDQSLSLKPEPDDALKTRRKLEEGLVEKESSTPKVANGAAASDTDKRSTP
jgi:Flp pilus assembly protein TadD